MVPVPSKEMLAKSKDSQLAPNGEPAFGERS
jgi:hypothetical protein